MDRVEAATRPVRIGLIGKYVNLPDAYLSVVEALRHGGYFHGARIDIDWIQAEDVEGLLAEGRLRDLDGIVIPGGFGERGIEGKIAAGRLCPGARHPVSGPVPRPAGDGDRLSPATCAGLAGANSRSSTPPRRTRSSTSWTSSARSSTWAAPCASALYAARLQPGSARWPGRTATTVVYERHRHRYEVNPQLPRAASRTPGWRCSARRPTTAWSSSSSCPATRCWVGTQAHPEFKSRPEPAPSAVPGAGRSPPSTGPRDGRRACST